MSHKPFIVADLRIDRETAPAVATRLRTVERALMPAIATSVVVDPADKLEFWHQLTVWAARNVAAIEGSLEAPMREAGSG